MTKTTRVMGILVAAGLMLGCNSGSGNGGKAGTNGGAGTSATGAAGTGTAGTGSAGTGAGTAGTGSAAGTTGNPDGGAGPAPKTVVPAAAGCTSIHLALSGSTLYWTDQGHGTVKSIGTAAGATAMTIASTQMGPTLLAVNGTSVFWVAGKTVMKSVAGAAPVMVAMNAMDIHGLTTSPDGATVYFSADKHILKVPAAGGTPTNIFDQADGLPGNLALEGTAMAFGSDEAQDIDTITLADGTVSKCGMRDDGGNGFCSGGLRLARSQGSILLDQVYLVSGKVYWAHGTDIATVSIMPTGTGAAMPASKIVSTALFENVSALFVQGTTVYFGEVGQVEKSPLTPGSEPTVLATGQPTPSSIVANADNIYWATGVSMPAAAADCAIMTVPAK